MAGDTGADNAEENEKSVPTDLSNAVALAKTAQKKFEVLKSLIQAVEIPDRDVLDTIFNLVSSVLIVNLALYLNKFFVKNSNIVTYFHLLKIIPIAIINFIGPHSLFTVTNFVGFGIPQNLKGYQLNLGIVNKNHFILSFV